MKQFRLSAALAAAALLALGAGATPVFATEVGGSVWTLEGSRVVTVQGQGRDDQVLGSAVLTFDGVAADRTGTCTMQLYKENGDLAATYPCTWKAPKKGNSFSIKLDVVELTAALQAEATESYGVPTVVVVKSQENHGVIRQQGTNMKLVMHTRGSVQAEGDRKRSVAILIKGTGGHS